MTAEAWTALAAWATVAVAGLAAYFGLKQYRATSEASAERASLMQLLAREEARPYVVAYMEMSAVGPGWVDLVVRNYGKTAARDVRMTSTPALRRSAPTGDATEPVKIFDVLGLLAPGQEWRCFWDRFWRRADEELRLPPAYQVVLTYSDGDGAPLEPVMLPLDWRPYLTGGTLEVYGIHHAADALRKLQKSVALFSESTGGRGVRVYSRDGDAKDLREHERYAAIRRQDELEESEQEDPS